MRLLLNASLFVFFILLSAELKAEDSSHELKCLQKAYPEHIHDVNKHFITWKDGTLMPLESGKSRKTQQEKLESPSLFDQIHKVHYMWGKPDNTEKFAPVGDPGHIRYEPFFKKMYGNSENEVEKKVVTIYWMPKVFEKKYPLRVTTVNEVHKKISLISEELEKLVSTHPEFKPFLDHPSGTFKWRQIANTQRFSPHSFGMAIDINSGLSNYWQWDLKKAGLPIKEETPLTYQNHIPWEIVLIFEKHGFIWGGKWQHYDSMHFEYRPELKKCL